MIIILDRISDCACSYSNGIMSNSVCLCCSRSDLNKKANLHSLQK